MSHFFSLAVLERGAALRRETRDEMRRLASHGDAYRDHCLMMKLFPAWQASWEGMEEAERARAFVFRRRDSQPQTQTAENAEGAAAGPRALSFYVVSSERPRPVQGLLSVQTKEYQPVLNARETIRFELRANPSVTRSRGGIPAPHGSRHKPRHDVLMLAKSALRATADRQANRHAMNEAASGWLTERAPAWGLRLDPGTLFIDSYTQHRLRRGEESICFSSVDYSGAGSVLDPVLLQRALLEGVGRKRGFGCGLLLVRRLA